MNIDDERKRFEEWAKRRHVTWVAAWSSGLGGYVDYFVQDQWEAWQARAALAESDAKAASAVNYKENKAA